MSSYFVTQCHFKGGLHIMPSARLRRVKLHLRFIMRILDRELLLWHISMEFHLTTLSQKIQTYLTSSLILLSVFTCVMIFKKTINLGGAIAQQQLGFIYLKMAVSAYHHKDFESAIARISSKG